MTGGFFEMYDLTGGFFVDRWFFLQKSVVFERKGRAYKVKRYGNSEPRRAENFEIIMSILRFPCIIQLFGGRSEHVVGGKSNENIRLGILWFSPWLQMTGGFLTGGFLVFGALTGGFYGKTTGRTGGIKNYATLVYSPLPS